MNNIVASIKILAATLLLFVYFPVAYADFDCDAKAEEINGKVSKYLYNYSEKCVVEESESFKAFKAAPSEAEKHFLMVNAWQDISKNFSELETSAPPESKIKGVFPLLAFRAKQARIEIQEDFSLRNLRDVSVARNASWKIPVHMIT